MLDKPTKNKEAAPGRRILQLLGFGGEPDKGVELKSKKPPKEPEERKHQFATWYIFAAFLGVMLIQSVWLRFTQVETIPYSQFEQLLTENKISEVLVGSDTIQAQGAAARQKEAVLYGPCRSCAR
jgi:cell division protease FtsH